MANNNNTKNLNVPNLRFPEFKGEWEETTLGKCVIQPLDYGMNTAAITYDGENKYIRITDIDEQSSQYISDSPVSPAGQLLDKYIVEENDILFARTGASTGKSYLYKKKDGKLYFAGFLIRAKIKTEYNSAFIFAQTKTAQYYKWVEFMSIRSGQPGINSQEYASYRFLIPQKEEQDKIATLFSLLNQRISTQSKIIERFESLIKGLSESLFSQRRRFMTNSGNNFPNWEIVKLREVMSIPEKKKPAIIDKNKLLTVKLHMKGVSENDNTETLSLGATNYFSRKKGQFIYGKQNLFNGAFGLIPDKLDGFLSSSDVPTLDINHKKLNGTFLVCYFSRESFYKKLEGLASGSGSKRIHETTLLDIKIHLPSLEEQAQIANFLSVINKKLETEKLILGNYIKQKRYLLNQMFT